MFRFGELDSTQRALVAQATELPAGSCFVAERQTAGHGREARSWASAPGGLYASFLLKPPGLLPELPWALNWAVLEALEHQTGLELTLKAPNDVLGQGRKLAGMLIDSRILGLRPEYYVCGLGINLNQRRFDAALADRAVSLFQLTGREWEPESVLAGVLKVFAEKYAWLGLAEFERRLLGCLGRRRVQLGYNGQEFTSFEEYWHGAKSGYV